MADYKCYFCGYQSLRKANVITHLLKKKKCSTLNKINVKEDINLKHHIIEIKEKKNEKYIKLDDGKIKCLLCNAVLTCEKNYKRHYSTNCKLVKTIKAVKEDNNDDILTEKIIDLIKQHSSQKSGENITNINSTNVTNNINNFFMCPKPLFHEDLSILTSYVVKQIINKCIKSDGNSDLLTSLISYIHFNKQFPQNWNIRFEGQDENGKTMVSVFEDSFEWKSKDIENFVPSFISSKFDQIDDKMYRSGLILNQKCYDFYEQYLKEHENMKTDGIIYETKKLIEDNEVNDILKEQSNHLQTSNLPSIII